MAATANGHVTALQLGASEPAVEDALPAFANCLPVEQCTSLPLPPVTPTKLALQQEATPQQTTLGNGVPTRPALPQPVLLTDEDDLAEVRPSTPLACCLPAIPMLAEPRHLPHQARVLLHNVGLLFHIF